MLYKYLILLIFLGGCASTSSGNFPVAKDSAQPGTQVTMGGAPAKLSSKTKMAIGKPFPKVALMNNAMKKADLDLNGRVSIISVVPSIDTKVCEVQTHALGETKKLHPTIQRLTVSVDLPFAQKRFAEETKLTNITYFSDFKDADFGKATGLQIQQNGLLARAVIVTDEKGVVRYIQVVPDVSFMPDMEKAFQVANDLAKT